MAASHQATAGGGTAASISSIVNVGEAVVGSICSFLRGTDTLRLHAVDRAWHEVLSSLDEEALFDAHLISDFGEGRILSYVAKERDLSRKKLYLAFIHRWSLPKRVAPDEKLCIHWRQPQHWETKEDDTDDDSVASDAPRPISKNADIGSLVFIARVGTAEDDADSYTDFCALMDWDYYGTVCEEMGRKLVPDYNRNEEIGSGLWFPDNEQACTLLEKATVDDKGSDWFDQLESALRESHRLTLHVIDVQRYQAVSLMDDTPFGDAGLALNGEGDMWIGGHGHDLPSIYALPHEDSPFYRKLSEKDFPKSCTYEKYDDSKISPFEVSGGLDIRFDHYVKKDYVKKEGDEVDMNMRFCQHGVGIELCADGIERDGLAFHFGLGYSLSINRICSFIRTLIKEKCAFLNGGQTPMTTTVPSAASLAQPEWIEIDEILDRVLSYASFEDQAGKLRRVCSSFGASALRELERKLDKVKVIGYQCDYEFGENWFKVSTRRGWSENCVTSKESAVEDALWFTSCRCSMTKCDDRTACPSTGNPVRYMDGGSAKVLDLEKARQTLAEKGSLNLEEPSEWDMRSDDYCAPRGATCSFSRKDMSLFELCDKVDTIINDRLRCELIFEGQECMLHPYLKKDYGVATNIPPRRFIRSLFLVFAKSKMERGSGDSTAKKARVAINEVTIGMAEANVNVEDGFYSRKKKIFRFFTSACEPMEIVIESKSNTCM